MDEVGEDHSALQVRPPESLEFKVSLEVLGEVCIELSQFVDEFKL